MSSPQTGPAIDGWMVATCVIRALASSHFPTTICLAACQSDDLFTPHSINEMGRRVIIYAIANELFLPVYSSTTREGRPILL